MSTGINILTPRYPRVLNIFSMDMITSISVLVF